MKIKLILSTKTLAQIKQHKFPISPAQISTQHWWCLCLNQNKGCSALEQHYEQTCCGNTWLQLDLNCHGELLVHDTLVSHQLNSLWVCQHFLKVVVVNTALKGKLDDFLLCLIEEKFIISRMISTNLLDSLVAVLDGANVCIVFCAVFLLHKSLFKEPPWATNLHFNTHVILACGKCLGTGWENGDK